LSIIAPEDWDCVRGGKREEKAVEKEKESEVVRAQRHDMEMGSLNET